MDLFLIIGLGNPGKKYEHTRHNVGFDVVEILAQMTKTKVSKIKSRALVGEGIHEGRRIILAKPQTFMNVSGESVVSLCAWYKPQPDHIIVVYDDVDLPMGNVRVRAGGSAGTHNGMRSIVSLLGRDDFPRVRVGVGKPPEGYDMADWVLSHYNDEQTRKVAFDSYMRAAEAVLLIATEGVEKSMQRINQKAPKIIREEET